MTSFTHHSFGGRMPGDDAIGQRADLGAQDRDGHGEQARDLGGRKSRR